MFGTSANVYISIPNGEWQPGQTIAGTVSVHTKSSLDVSAIDISLQGTVTTVVYRRPQRAGNCDERTNTRTVSNEYTGDSDAESCLTDQVSCLRQEEVVFPPKYLGKQKPRTLKKGAHTYDFSIKIPETCESTDSEWMFMPLPASCSLPSKRGGITYRLQANVRRPGLFSKTVTANQPIRIARYGEMPTSSRLAFARRGLTVGVFPNLGKTGFMFKVKQGLGLTAPSWKQHLTAELRVPVAGIPVSSLARGAEGTLVLDNIQLFVSREEDSSPKEKPVTFYLTALKLVLVGTYTVRARGAVETLQQREKLLSVKPQLALKFTDGTADLTNLVTNAAVLGDFVPTLLLPALQVSYELQAELSIAPDPTESVPTHVIITTPLVLRNPLPPPQDASSNTPPEKSAAGPAGQTELAEPAEPVYETVPAGGSGTASGTHGVSLLDPRSRLVDAGDENATGETDEAPPSYESHAPAPTLAEKS